VRVERRVPNASPCPYWDLVCAGPGREEGREEGLEEGVLIGQIRALQGVFELPVTPETDLKTLSIEQLQSRLRKLQASRRRMRGS
jgi:hypothetical protein